MKRHFNPHLEGLDLKFWHDLIESRGKLVSNGMPLSLLAAIDQG